MQTMAADNKCKDYDRRLIKPFIYGLHNDGMIGEILGEIILLENTDDASGEWVLILIQRVETHIVQKEVLNNITEAKELDSISQDKIQ